MTIHTVVNGNVSVVLTGETELEKMILKMLAKGDVTIEEVSQQNKTQLLDKIIPEGVIITSKKREE